MSVFWDSGCRFFGTPNVGFLGVRMSVCRFFGTPNVGFLGVRMSSGCRFFNPPFYPSIYKRRKSRQSATSFFIFSNFCSVFYVFLFPTPFLYLRNGTKKPCDCSNHRVSLVWLTGLEPACLGNTRSLVLRVCQFRHNRISDCSAFAEQSLLYTISAWNAMIKFRKIKVFHFFLQIPRQIKRFEAVRSPISASHCC